ncbi:MAG: nucleoside triphosphate pyrophosphohydrolase, partial [Xanthomonadales bacterium]|nr:nucleoside triphosphate pyrophosphohydrolase [Xanthomonadales bacterium]
MQATREIADLLQIMARLRNPEGGCPWDLEQDFRSVAPYTIEEAYEVADAIERGSMAELVDELGDLLLQVVFHAQMGQEAGLFDFGDVVRAINDKMIRRHPHVFGDAEVRSAAAQTEAWEQMKAAERGRQGSRLDAVSRGLPEWLRAHKLQKQAARAGFEWPDVDSVLAKLQEEIGELRAELAAKAPSARVQDELGDVAFVLVNLARHLDVDYGAALRGCNA